MESFQSPRNRRVVLRSTLALLSLQPAIGSALPGRCAGNRRPFTGKKRRSACTDSLVDAAFLFTLKAVHHLPAQNILRAFGRSRPRGLRPEPPHPLSAHKLGAHSPRTAIRGGSPCAAFAASITRSPATLRHRAGSGESSRMYHK